MNSTHVMVGILFAIPVCRYLLRLLFWGGAKSDEYQYKPEPVSSVGMLGVNGFLFVIFVVLLIVLSLSVWGDLSFFDPIKSVVGW